MSEAPKLPAPKKFLGVKIRKATPAEADIPTPAEVALSTAPSSAPIIPADMESAAATSVGTEAPAAVRRFFGKAATTQAPIPSGIRQPVKTAVRPLTLTKSTIAAPSTKPTTVAPVTAKPSIPKVKTIVPPPAEVVTAATEETIEEAPEAIPPPSEFVAPLKETDEETTPFEETLVAPLEVVPPPPTSLARSEADIKRSVLQKLKKEFDDAAAQGLSINDFKGEEKDGRQFYDFPIDATEDELKLLDPEFKTLLFTPDGFSAEVGEVFNKDLLKLSVLMKKSVEAPRSKKIIPTAALPEEILDFTEPNVIIDGEEIDFTGTELEEYAKAIKEEETRSPYDVANPPHGYVPQTRRGFSNFIRETYSNFTLPPLPGEPDYDACMKLGAQGAVKAEIYQYQKFVRDYMTWSSPYRGVLVYHGLGSGKTCTAIAAAEALFATSNRKIIVMTPKSLRKNFIREITFCGFRHFRLLNHWVKFPNDPNGNPLVRMFASKVLNIPISHLKKAKNIWIPDFTKPQNYQAPRDASPEEKKEYLNATEQTEVREQIQAIIVYEPHPNPRLQKDGRIWFINYNGITPTKLKEIACAKPNTAFDNAVIVVDEIHNLIRLMQGTIEPYLSELKGIRRKISPEPVTSEKWAPKLCGRSMNYKRGYLFYRLLVGAQNSKIIGLSGTPLINFPEELAILSNVLYGYIHIAEVQIAKKGSSDENMRVKEIIEKTAESNIYVDYYRVTIGDMGIRITITPLAEGIRKIKDDIGVERIPQDENPVNIVERIESFKRDLAAAGVTIPGTFKIRSEALLPPFGEQFRENFIMQDGIGIKNRNVLLKRLSGLISYYKGSRKDLMPMVTKDEVVRVPFSPYQQEQYSRIRVEEIDIEKKKDKEKPLQGGIGVGRLGALWAEVYEIKNMKQSSNYRMGSRQACNFVFPPGIGRPRPMNQREALEETGPDPVDLLDEIPHDTATTDEPDNIGSILDEEEAEQAEAEAEDALVEQQAEQLYLEEQKVKLKAAGKSEQEVRIELEKLLQEYRDRAAPELIAAEEPIDAGLSDEEKQCRAVRLRGETYVQAVQRSKKCLATIGRNKLLLENPDGLYSLSPKFAAMIQKINEAKGSSLVYSQFLQMEGIGIFTIALQANGFEPIVIETGGAGPRFSNATIESLRKGPQANQPRFITFTGGEEEEVRRYAVDIFNAKFSELPRAMSEVLQEAGYTNNQKGELCRVFCITSAGAEGLSLKNVRAVHIMEPYWNDVRTAQVKGRAVRICSHMDIQPPSERTVEIFTYVTVFGPEAQLARTGSMRITEDIMLRDSLTPKEAKEAKLPIPDGAGAYVLTSDERLFVISERKKALIGNLERVMKSAAVDCQINFNENQDGTYTCALFGKAGGFLYNPDLDLDIAETQEVFGEGTVAPVVQQATTTSTMAAPVPTAKTRRLIPAKVGDKTFYLEKGVDKTTGAAVYYIFGDTTSTNPIGQSEVDPATGGPKKGTAKMYKK